MIQIIKAAAVLAVVVAMLGVFSVYGNVRIVDFAFADGHDGGGEPPPEEYYEEPPPPEGDCCFDPPPNDSPPPEGDFVECTDCAPPPEGDFVALPPEGDFVALPPEGDFVECTDCAPPSDGDNFFEPPPDGEYFECTDCTFEQPADREFFFEPPADGEYYDVPPEGEFYFEPPPGDFVGGEFNPEGGEFPDGSVDPGFEGTFFFDDHGDFVFDGVPTGDGEFNPEFDGLQYFPDGDFQNFFNPGDFEPDLFIDTFRPDEFAGDFGDFFIGDDFQSGAFDDLFNPDEFRPDEFGSFFVFDDFQPGDFGEFATVGDTYVDFGGHFDQFWGERTDEAQFASDFFAGFDPGEFGFAPPEELLGELGNLDYQGFQDLDSSFVTDLFNDGLAGQDIDLRGDQWAGAFSKFDVDDIRGFDQDFVAGAVIEFAPEDFLGIPDDQAFAMFQATFFGAPPPGEPFEGGSEGELPPPSFDPEFFDQRLDEFEGQIGGFLGAMGPEHFGDIGDGQLVDMFGRVDFAAPDFDRTVLGGDDLGGIFGSLDVGSFADMGQDQIMGAIGGLSANDFKDWDPGAAFNVFDNIDFDQSVGMEHMGGLVGAMGPDQFQNIEGGQLVGLFDSFAFGGPDFVLDGSGMDRDDIAGMIGDMDFQNMSDLGGDGIVGALGQLDGISMGAWEGNTAFDVFSTIGFDQALELDQLEGIVGNFAVDQIQQLGDDLGGLLGGLDFQNNGELLQDFSFDTLGVLSPEDFQGLGPQQLVDLANTTGGDGIVGLDAGQIQNILGNTQVDFFQEFDPSVLGGMFAGLDDEQIGGFDHETMGAALEAAGANLLGGLGDFDAIAGGDTAFDFLANLTDVGEALDQDGSFVIQDGVFDFFSGNLFGSN